MSGIITHHVMIFSSLSFPKLRITHHTDDFWYFSISRDTRLGVNKLQNSVRALTICSKRRLLPHFNVHRHRAKHRTSRQPISFYILTPRCRILFEKLIVTQVVKKYPAFFMEPEGSLSCSQKPATGPYSEPGESSSPHRSLSP
jgi:hypothetical protein